MTEYGPLFDEDGVEYLLLENLEDEVWSQIAEHGAVIVKVDIEPAELETCDRCEGHIVDGECTSCGHQNLL